MSEFKYFQNGLLREKDGNCYESSKHQKDDPAGSYVQTLCMNHVIEKIAIG